MDFYNINEIPDYLRVFFDPAPQLGLEKTPEEYIANMVTVFREVKRVLRDDGTLWLNIGDSYANTGVGSFNGGGFKDKSALTGGRDMSGVATSGSMNKFKASGLKQKDLVGIPWMLAFALRADGWYLRQDIIWHKPNPMPESVTDRCTKAHEYIFLLSKSDRYYYDHGAIAGKVKPQSIARNNRGVGANHKNIVIPGQTPHSMHKARVNGDGYAYNETVNKRSVWTVTTKPYNDAHFATFPEDLIVDCIKAGCPVNGLVLDPFGGAGTTALVSAKFNRNYILYELNEKYISIANKRLQRELGMFNPMTA